jgi:hypothetical protein
MEFLRNRVAPAVSQIWAYFIDDISKTELVPPKEEILQAEWVPISELSPSKDSYKGLKVGKEITASLAAATSKLGFQRIFSAEEEAKKKMGLYCPIPSEK